MGVPPMFRGRGILPLLYAFLRMARQVWQGRDALGTEHGRDAHATGVPLLYRVPLDKQKAAGRYRSMLRAMLGHAGKQFDQRYGGLTDATPATVWAAGVALARVPAREALERIDLGGAFADAGGSRRGAFFGLVFSTLVNAGEPGDGSRWHSVAKRQAADVGALTAFEGSAAVAGAWAAVGLLDPSIAAPEAEGVFRRLVDEQQPAGHFLKVTPEDQLEPWWYHELVLLQAVASAAKRVRDQSFAAELSAAAGRAVRHHLAETQPDHATNRPWGVNAFLDAAAQNPDALPFVDSLLHGASFPTAAGVAGLDEVSALILADAVAGF